MAEIAVITTKLEHALTKLLQEEWIAQGHYMNGKIIDEIEYVVTQTEMTLTLSGMMAYYGNIVAAGTKPNRIPYGGRTGRGGTSMYITALQNYVKMRMRITDEKKSKSIAFAIATEQKKHGMPTPGSYGFTKTGKRTDYVEEAFRKGESAITEQIREMAYGILTVRLDALLAKWQIELNN